MSTVENRRILVNALRSGEYEYGRGELRSIGLTSSGSVGECHCVFGVACNEYQKLHPKISQWILGGTEEEKYWVFHSKNEDYGESEDNCYPPTAVTAFFGITLDQQRELMGYNDNQCASFFQMAEKMEEMFPNEHR